MSKTLIIAEKPSVAADIARALGGFARHDDYFESEDRVVTSAIGHLLELTVPDGVEVKRGKWSFNNLPVIPPHFELQPIARSEARLKLLAKLIRRKDVSALINACDAGREGELIFRYIIQYCKAKQPIQRLWLQSMTQAAIREGFEALRADRELLPLADAAKCRSEADWLIGINGTRAMTAFNSKEGGFYKTTVGRVQTPTLVVLIDREEKIRAFKPRDYWEVHARFEAKAGQYEGRWFDPKFRKDDDGERRAERIWSHDDADGIVALCRGKKGTVSEESKPTTQLSPLLFDLTSLQREANARFGFSAKSTLALAQALYERHKVLTYPRTDARALPEDYLATVRSTLAMFGGAAGKPGKAKPRKEAADEAEHATPYARFASEILTHEWVRPNKRIFDNSKISDHFAIIPTLQLPKSLSEPEQKLYDLVVRRFLAVFYPAAESLQTTRITVVDEQHFKSEGKILQKPGWLVVYGREAQDDDARLVAVEAGERPEVAEIAALGQQTRPPARYTEATLLSAMEGAGKFVEDEELRAAMDAKGLGTPATRAAIIEGLISEEYVVRQGRELVPTPKAFSLLFALRHFGVTELTSPELTGDWEFKLKQMELGKLARPIFMEHITAVTQDLVARIKNGDIPDTAFATLSEPCPKCGGVVQENYRKFQCQVCDFSLWKVTAGREWAPEEVDQLIRDGRIGPLTGFRSRQGRPFAASMRLNDEKRVEFDFGQSSSADGEGKPDFSGQESLGHCPKCNGNVYEHGSGYTCENAVGSERSCDFRVSRIILQQPIERAQLQKLLSEGRTDLLPRFISKKGRPFRAYLVKNDGGGIGFEFQPRASKTAANSEAETAPSRARTRRRAV